MRRKHSRMMAIILSTIILAGCSNSSHLSVSQTHSSPSATAQPRPTAEPLAVSVSPERSCYQQLYDQPDNPNWALYAEITITNYTDQPLTIETIFLYPNHQFYGEDAIQGFLVFQIRRVQTRLQQNIVFIAENFSRNARCCMEVLRVLVADCEENHTDSIAHIGLATTTIAAL